MERYGLRLVNLIQRIDIWPVLFRRMLLRLFFPEISRSAVILSDCQFCDGRISVGERVFVNRGCLLECAGGIEIGSDAHLAFGVSLITSSHELGTGSRRCGPTTTNPIRIGAGAWLGANATVLPGVTIGAGAVIAAGSMVTSDIPPNHLAAGIPATIKQALAA